MLQVSGVIARRFLHRIAAEFLQKRLGQHDGGHRLADHSGRRDGGDVGALDLRLKLLFRPDIDAVQRPGQRRQRFYISAKADLLTVGNPPFDPPAWFVFR